MPFGFWMLGSYLMLVRWKWLHSGHRYALNAFIPRNAGGGSAKTVPPRTKARSCVSYFTLPDLRQTFFMGHASFGIAPVFSANVSPAVLTIFGFIPSG
jgi:hypothetical protein